MADLPTVLAFGLAGLAVVVWTAVLVLALRRRRPAGKRSLAADVPSGPVVPAADLLPAVWISDVDRVRPEPWAYRTRHYTARRPSYSLAVCDRTSVDEVHRVTEEVS